MSSVIPAPHIAAASGIFSPDVVGLLVVSTNSELRRDLVSRLQSRRWSVKEASSGAAALETIDAGLASLVLLDPALPDLRVDEFREILRAQYPHIEIVPINAHTGQPMVADPPPDSTSFEVVRDMGRGGPLKTESFLPPVGEEPLRGEEGLPGFVGTSPSVQRLCAMARLVAQRDTTVLITGESGTGKDLVAQAVHRLSLRRLKPFVVINCAAIPEPLLEAELFGFVKGAFTGAVQSRIGRIHAAQGGTLFLDEIGDLPLLAASDGAAFHVGTNGVTASLAGRRPLRTLRRGQKRRQFRLATVAVRQLGPSSRVAFRSYRGLPGGSRSRLAAGGR
jgi:CheY-like chemotaxis protein